MSRYLFGPAFKIFLTNMIIDTDSNLTCSQTLFLKFYKFDVYFVFKFINYSVKLIQFNSTIKLIDLFYFNY